MQANIVNPSNALLATRFLLNLDINAIKNPYQSTLREEVLTIKEALASLQNPNQAEQLYQNLYTLAASANHLVNALSDDARERLTYFVNVNKNQTL